MAARGPRNGPIIVASVVALVMARPQPTFDPLGVGYAPALIQSLVQSHNGGLCWHGPVWFARRPAINSEMVIVPSGADAHWSSLTTGSPGILVRTPHNRAKSGDWGARAHLSAEAARSR